MVMACAWDWPVVSWILCDERTTRSFDTTNYTEELINKMPESVADYRRYLDPRTLARIGSLDLRARLVVEGLMTGMHRSPYQGISVEFAQHRPYVAGDDIRHVDWKVFGRSDKIYLKQYLEETNLHLI